MLKPLLIEIAVEELPAIPFLKELPNIEKKWADILEANALMCEFEFYYTPRRLVFWHREFKVAQDDTTVEMLGAPLAIAYKDGEPTGAAIGFAKKCGVELSELSTIDKGRGEVLYYKKVQIGQESKELLNSMVNEFITKLDFGKSMRWGSLSESFIRPIRGLSILLGDELIDGELYTVKSSKETFVHRMVSYNKILFENASEYFDKLKENGVVLYADERKNTILSQMDGLEAKHGIQIERDIELLDEVVAITEYPTALIGKFDEEFLELPDEVIVNSMKEHQRYFAVYKDGKITNNFIVVSNSYTTDFSEIIAGNEKVLRPRLADGMFFWKNDIKNGLSNEGLKNITFVEGLGSMYDKCVREASIASELANMFDVKETELLQRAVMLSKSDLLTDMVYEFTELQGLMGYYYGKIANEDELVYTAFKEQYLPDGEDSELPSNKFSSIVALSNKIDNLMGLFSMGMIPTGSRDPFALRRAAAGIVKICMEHKLNLDFSVLIANTQKEYSNLDVSKLMEFFNERLFKIFNNVNPSVIKAVLASGESDILKITQKIDALNPIVNSKDFSNFSATFKRVANIIKDIDTNAILNVDASLFEDNEETALFEAYNSVVAKEYPNYEEELDALFGLKATLDNFFDNVFVNHENEAIKTNRKNLIGLVYQAFKNIADIKEITI
jgi:glycyl-tRNA synthetase beta chain